MTALRRLLALLLAPLLVAALVAVTTTPAAADGSDPVGVWPLQPPPEVVRGFDPPDVVWGAGHRGVDLLGSPGQAVHAALAGSVTFAGQLAGRGVVVVDHGATRTTYEPVLASVAVGTPLPRDAVIGSLATAGSHCLPRSCLHWGWREGDTYLDPLRLVGVGPVRLLPLWRDEPVPPVARPFVPVPPVLPVSPYAALLAVWPPVAWPPVAWPPVAWPPVAWPPVAWPPVARWAARAPPLRLGGEPAGTPAATGPW